MKISWTAFVVVCTMLLLSPGSSLAQNGAPRDGFWANFGLGYGSLGQEEFNGRQGGEALQLAVGGSVNEQLLVGASFNAWSRLENGWRIEAGFVGAIARYYPADTGGFYVSGGLGLGMLGEDVSFSGPGTETGFGGLLGIGYDLRVGGSVRLTPFATGYLVGNSDSDVDVIQLGLGVTFH